MLLKPLVASLDPKSKDQTDAAAVCRIMGQVVSSGGSIATSLITMQWLRYANDALDQGVIRAAEPPPAPSSASDAAASAGQAAAPPASTPAPAQKHLVQKGALAWGRAFDVRPESRFLPKVLFDTLDPADVAKFREDW